MPAVAATTALPPYLRFYVSQAAFFDVAEECESIPGVKARGNYLQAPTNAAWLIERILRARGVEFKLWQPTAAKFNLPAGISGIAGLRAADPLTGLAMRDFLAVYQVREAFKYARFSGCLLNWPPGCLSGDAEIVVNRGGSARRMKLCDLVRKFNGGYSSPRRQGGGPGRWDLSIPTSVQSCIDGAVRLNRLVAAISSGVKETFTVQTESGKTLRATKDHRFYSSDGNWLRLEQLAVGTQIVVNAGQRSTAPKAPKLYYPAVGGMKHHPFATYKQRRRKTLNGRLGGKGYSDSYRVPRHRLVVEAELSGLDFEPFVTRVRAGQVHELVFLDPRETHVHHKDGDTRNWKRSNLESLTEADHLRHHAETGGWRHVAYKVGVEKITAIKPHGLEETFDLTMEEPHNNFVANEIVVHNSGKSLGAILWALLGPPGPIVVVTGAKGRSQWASQIQRYTTLLPHVLLGTDYVEDFEFPLFRGPQAEIRLRKDVLRRAELKCSCGEAHSFKLVQSADSVSTGLLLKCRVRLLVGRHDLQLGMQAETALIVEPTVLPTTGFVIVGWETLPFHVDKLVKLRPTSTILDECFPPTTPVLTKTGCKPIAAVREGDLVWSIDVETGVGSWNRVTKSWKRPLKAELVKIVHEHGSLICTPNHHIWTEAGYAQASALARGVRLSCLPKELRATVSTVAVVESSHVLDSMCAPEGGQRAGRDDARRTQPDTHAWSQSEDFKQAERSPVSHKARWERHGLVGGATGLGASTPSFAGGVYDRVRQRSECSIQDRREELQSGFGRADSAASDRSRRDFTQSGAHSESRPPERTDLVSARVERVEILERGGPSEHECGGGDNFVYDLEVEGNHNYFASGVLVSNSHRGKSPKKVAMVPLSEAEIANTPEAKQLEDGRWVKFVDLENIAASTFKLCKASKRRALLTATLIKDRVRDLWAQLNYAEPWQWGRYAVWCRRYCAAVPNQWGGLDDKGSSNLEELDARMSFIRSYVTIEESHGGLPPMRRDLMLIPPDAQQRADEALDKELADAVLRRADIHSIASIKMAQACSRKRKAVVEEVVEAVNGGAKVTVFTARRHDVDVMKALLPQRLSKKAQAFFGHGGETPEERYATVQQYMRLPSHAVLVGTGYAFGEQIDLNETDIAIIAMLPFTIAELVQWEGRFWRKGSTRSVLIKYMIAESTYDEHVANILLSKLPAVEKIGMEGAAGLRSVLRGDEEKLLAELAELIKQGE
jgi:hypothetical protein